MTTTTSALEPYLPLSVAEIFMLPLNIDDPEVKAVVEKRNRGLLRKRVDVLNANYDECLEKWPDGTNIEFYTGFKEADYDFFDFINQLEDDQFKTKVRSLANQYMNSASSITKVFLSHETPTNSPRINLTPVGVGSSEPEMPDISKWQPNYLNGVIRLISGDYTYDEVYQKTRFTEAQYKYVKLELEKRNLVEKKKKKKGSKAEKKEKNAFTSITFVKNNISYRFGMPLIDKYDPEMNPFHGDMDPLSGKPIRRPMICPDGYVLDYDSWYQNVRDYHLHPYTGKHMGSMHSLEELTTANFHLFKEIRNFDLIKS